MDHKNCKLEYDAFLFSTLLVSWFPHALKKDPNGIKAILEISSLVVCPNYDFWRGYKYIFSQFIVIISIFVDCNKSKFLKKKKKPEESKITYVLLSEEFLAVWFNLFIYPTGIDRMLVMSQAFQELNPYSQKFT